MAPRPNSLAGTSTVAAARRTGAACCRRSSRSPRAIAAGCAGTTAGVNRSTVAASEPSHGARTSTPGLLVERAAQVQNGRSGAQRLPPVLAGKGLCTAEKSKIHVLEGIGTDGLDKGNLVAHLVELAQTSSSSSSAKVDAASGDSEIASFSSLPSRRRGSCNRNFVHRHPSIEWQSYRKWKYYRNRGDSRCRFFVRRIGRSSGRPGRRRRDQPYAARAQMPENI